MVNETTIETGRGRFVAVVDGPDDGPVVICLHGFPDDATTFGRLQSALADAGYRSIAPYLRGYAPSPLDPPYAISDLVADLVALADAVSPDAAVRVVGHDYGAQLTYAALARHRDRFASAVTLAGPHPTAVTRNARRHARQWWMSRYIVLFQLPGVAERRVARDDFAYVEELWRRWSPGLEPPPDHLRRVKDTLAASMPHPVAMYRAGGFDIGTDPIDVPLLCLLGRRDGCVLPAMAQGQGTWCTGPYERLVLPDVGHFLHHEDPDRVAHEVHRWLRRHDTGEPD